MVQSYALFGLAAGPNQVPGLLWAAWMEEWLWAPSFVFLFAILLLFPTGHLLTPRWGPVAVTAVAAPLLFALGDALHPGPLIDFPAIENPIGWEPMRGIKDAMYPLPGLLILAGVLVALGSSVLLRFRRARRVERQQLEIQKLAPAEHPLFLPPPPDSRRQGSLSTIA